MAQIIEMHRTNATDPTSLEARAYLVKVIGSQAEVYDRGYRLLATISAAQLRRLEAAILASGRARTSDWPQFRGGATRTPGDARWYDWRRSA